mmetsp:Transcript_11829/g.21620  ORF Transcript_11829/g.21620 Transcript_11829/m.21620 type:complete len:124 (+) Transcript_11829:113-484(+)|eukprot:CAMPEP_0197535160 /NCGR_PEP_ID=MMETSP1318-20131121/49609_1 /TAXON_ID=552666 /ORGANISM="Partenskyella glossopodia, Strain RCC365" /LENGTH=123 /DNA_ID=CAMNT_0043092663 /DNA_START=87 /DNA_END=458 /DNA_ORIENTATION=+
MNQEGRDVFAYLKKEKDEESFAGKAWRKFKQDPLVPTFFGLTCMALVGGLRAMNRGDSKRSNLFMRYRVIAQSGCIVALAYAGYNGRLITDRDGKRTNRSGGGISSGPGPAMPPGIPPLPPGE